MKTTLKATMKTAKKLLEKARARSKRRKSTTGASSAQTSTTDLGVPPLQADSIVSSSRIYQNKVAHAPESIEASGHELQLRTKPEAQHLGAGSNSSSVDVDNDPALVADCWSRAVSQLDERHQSMIEKLTASTAREAISFEPAAQVKSLLGDCQTLQQQRASERSQWEFNLLGQSFSVRRLLDGLVETLEKGLRLVENAAAIATSVDPVHAVAPYLLMKALLAVTTANSRQEGALYMGLDQALPVIFRCQTYERVISHARSNRPSEELDGFEMALTNLCACVLRFLCAAQDASRANTPGRIWHTLWDPAVIFDFEKSFVSLEQAVQIEATANRDISLIHLSDTITTEISSSLFGMNRTVETLKETWEEEDRVEILRWVSTVAVEDIHEDLRRRRTHGTCAWILRRSEFLQWKTSQGPLMLWVHGIPGAGKTRLISKIIDEFRALSEAATKPPYAANKPAYAYFYCSKGVDDRQNPEDVLRSFVKQLAASHKPVFPLLHRKYASKAKSGFLSAKLSIDECGILLREILTSFNEAFLILDALDECHEETRGILVSELNALVEAGLPVKIVISSRRDHDITARLQCKTNIGIEATENNIDIRTFVQSRIAAHIQDQASLFLISPTLQEKITKTLSEKSNGMFLWAKLHLDHILSRGKASDMEKDLGKLTPGMDGVFLSILNGINANKEGLKDIGLGTIKWLLSHDGVCWEDDLFSALYYDIRVDHETFDPLDTTYETLSFDLNVQIILKSCLNLVEHNPRGMVPTFRFIHLSVQEYLLQHHWAPDAHAFAAEKCLHRLLDLRLQRRLQHSNFNLVAITEWFMHLQVVDQANIISLPLLALLKSFVGPAGALSPYVKMWLKTGGWAHRRARSLTSGGYAYRQARSLTSGVVHSDDPIFRAHFVCVVFYLGLETAFGYLLRERSSPFVDFHLSWNSTEVWEDGPRGLALSPVTSCNMLRQCLGQLDSDNDAIRDLLWHLLANMQRQMKFYYGPELKIVLGMFTQCIVEHAANDEIGVLLVKAGDIFLRRWRVAAMESEERVKQLATKETARASQRRISASLRYRWQNTGQAQSIQTQSEVSRRLDKGTVDKPKKLAHLSCREWSGVLRTVLYSLNYSLDQQVAEFLAVLIATIDVAAESGVQSGLLTPLLLIATSRSLIQSCLVLLSTGSKASAEVTALPTRDMANIYGSALVMACARGDLDLVRMFIDHGADVNATCSRAIYPTAFVAAWSFNTWRRHSSDEDPPDGPKRRILSILLDRNPDVNATHPGGLYETALIAACQRGDIQFCQDLLDRGADVNQVSAGGVCRTALIAAALWSSGRPRQSIDCAFRLRMCRLLLEHGANVNTVVTCANSPEFGTALIAASFQDDADLCQCLITYGADVHATCGGIHPSALAAAKYAQEHNDETQQSVPVSDSMQAKMEAIRRAMQVQPREIKTQQSRHGGALRVLQQYC